MSHAPILTRIAFIILIASAATPAHAMRDPLGYPDGLNTYAGYHIMHGTHDPYGLSTTTGSDSINPTCELRCEILSLEVTAEPKALNKWIVYTPSKAKAAWKLGFKITSVFTVKAENTRELWGRCKFYQDESGTTMLYYKDSKLISKLTGKKNRIQERMANTKRSGDETFIVTYIDEAGQNLRRGDDGTYEIKGNFNARIFGLNSDGDEYETSYKVTIEEGAYVKAVKPHNKRPVIQTNNMKGSVKIE